MVFDGVWLRLLRIFSFSTKAEELPLLNAACLGLKRFVSSASHENYFRSALDGHCFMALDWSKSVNALR